MRFLVCNDDGITAPGLAALVQALALEGEVYVVAPDGQRSANSHLLTLHSPLTVRTHTLPGATKAWAVSGSPADCVKLGITALLPQPPDMVVSGINQGSNLASDCIYSGTIAGALEGVIMGLPGVAVSLDSFTCQVFGPAATIAAYICRSFHSLAKDGTPFALNINVPALPAAKIKGICPTAIGTLRCYDERYEATSQPDGTLLYRYAGQVKPVQACQPDGYRWDEEAVGAGYVSVTPLSYSLYAPFHHPVLDTLLAHAFSDPAAIL